MRSRIVIDACVLTNQVVADVLLTLAKDRPPLFFPFWTKQILDETYRAHTSPKLRWQPYIAESFTNQVLRNFPASLVGDYEHWIPQCTNDSGDRHVLACAIEARAEGILTYNLRDFKDEHLAPWGIRALHPQHYLLELYEQSPNQVIDGLVVIAQKLSHKAGREVTLAEELQRLTPFVPEFASQLLREIENE